MSAAEKWAREEIGCCFSQSFGNINVPETALSRLIEQRDQLKAQCEKMGACLQELDHSRHLLAAGHSAELIAFMRRVHECISDDCGKAILERDKEARWLLTHLPDSHQFNPQPDWWQRREAWLKGQP